MPRWVIFVSAVFVLAGCSSAGRFVVKLSANEIQKRIDEKFPKQLEKLLFELRLERPEVSINTESERIEIAIRVTGLVAEVEAGYAMATVTGGIRYNQNSGEFLLNDPHVIRFDASYIPENTWSLPGRQ